MILTNIYTIGKRKVAPGIFKTYISNNIIRNNRIRIISKNIVNAQTIIGVDVQNKKHTIALYKISNKRLTFNFTKFGNTYWKLIGNILVNKNNNVQIIKNYKIGQPIVNKPKVIKKPITKPQIPKIPDKNYPQILNFFDRIFIINLRKRTDRWKKCLKQLKNHNIKHFERFDAIKPDFNTIDKNQYSNLVLDKNNKDYIVGAMGCKFSHLNIIKTAKKRNYNRILILEDDFIFCKNFKYELYQRLKNIVKLNWDMFYLGSSRHENSIETKYPYINKTVRSGVNTTHAYCVPKRMYTQLINGITHSTCEIDAFYRFFQSTHNVYISKPSMITQNIGYSDILSKRVSYRHLID